MKELQDGLIGKVGKALPFRIKHPMCLPMTRREKPGWVRGAVVLMMVRGMEPSGLITTQAQFV